MNDIFCVFYKSESLAHIPSSEVGVDSSFWTNDTLNCFFKSPTLFRLGIGGGDFDLGGVIIFVRGVGTGAAGGLSRGLFTNGDSPGLSTTGGDSITLRWSSRFRNLVATSSTSGDLSIVSFSFCFCLCCLRRSLVWLNRVFWISTDEVAVFITLVLVGGSLLSDCWDAAGLPVLEINEPF